jgi:prepilin-type N-terminal cleavage/methylation domain-containing protein/prepilin-type processing-associated H-X9-DG protein
MKKFTLIELLVVIAIIGILASLLLPSLGKARKKAIFVVCKSSEKQIGIAVSLFSDDNEGYFPAAPAGIGHRTWDDRLADYDGRSLTDAQLDESQGILASTMTGANLYLCPADGIAPSDTTKLRRTYAFNNGASLNGNNTTPDAWGLNKQYNPPDPYLIHEISSSSETLMVGEIMKADNYLGKTWFSVIASATDVEREVPHENTKRNILFVDGHVDKRLLVQLEANNYEIFMNTKP